MTHIVSLICAYAHDRVIGRGNDLPWHIPADLEHFKNLTKGHPIIMGRLTYDSILMRRNGKPLPHRPHYVVTRQDLGALPEGVFAFKDIQSAIAQAKSDHPNNDVFIIGGASIYQQSISLVDRMYLTLIDMDVDGGDAFFPEYHAEDWIETERTEFLNEAISYTFLTLDRKNGKTS